MNSQLASDELTNQAGRDSTHSLKPVRPSSGKMSGSVRLRQSKSRCSNDSRESSEEERQARKGKRIRVITSSISAERKKNTKRATISRKESNMSQVSQKSSDKSKPLDEPRAFRARVSELSGVEMIKK